MERTPIRLLRSASAATVSQAWRIGVTLLTYMALRRVIPPEEMGTWNWALALFVLSAVFLIPRTSRSQKTSYLVFGALAVAVFGWFLAMRMDSGDSVLTSRFQEDESTESRVTQYTEVMTMSRPVAEHLTGSGANYAVAGHRVHNLILSSWYEGGLIALAAILLQYGALIYRGLAVSERGWNGVALCALLVAGITRTMVAGGGGYYTASGMLAVMTFLVLTDHPFFGPAADAGRGSEGADVEDPITE